VQQFVGIMAKTSDTHVQKPGDVHNKEGGFFSRLFGGIGKKKSLTPSRSVVKTAEPATNPDGTDDAYENVSIIPEDLKVPAPPKKDNKKGKSVESPRAKGKSIEDKAKGKSIENKAKGKSQEKVERKSTPGRSPLRGKKH